MALRGALSQSYRKYRKGCKMTQEKEYFILVPRTVARRNDLSDGAKLLYGEILGLSKVKGYCYANNKRFTKALGLTLRTLQRKLDELENFQLITRSVIRNEKKTVIERRIYPTKPNDSDDMRVMTNIDHTGDTNDMRVMTNNTLPHDTDDTYSITLNNTYKYTESNTYKDKTISQYINNTVDKKDPNPEKRRDELLAQVREYQSGAKEDDLNE